MPEPVRVALVGYGRAGRTLHAPLIRATEGFELPVIASSRVNDIRADLPPATIIAPPRDAVAMPGIDLVVIATPHDTHASLARMALAAGKHVVVDKPIAASLDEARGLAASAAREGRLLSAFHNRRWDGDFMALREAVRGGMLGEVRHFESHFDRYRPRVAVRWREEAHPGSGVWWDLGPHLVDQALQLFGVPYWVLAVLARHRPEAQADDYAHVVLGYQGRTVVLHASMIAAANRPRFVVHGARGSWVKSGLDPQEVELARSVGVDAGAVPHESATWVDGATGVAVPVEIPRGDYRRYYVALLAALRHRQPNPVTPVEATAVVAVIEAAVRSSNTLRAQIPALTGDERLAFPGR